MNIEKIITDLNFSKLINIFTYNPKEPLVFNSAAFLIIFTLFLFFYQLFYKNKKARIAYIALFSLYFYYKSSGIYFILLIFTTLINYWAAFKIDNTEKQEWRKFYLFVSVFSSLSLLGYFKYTNLLIDTFNNIFTLNISLQDIFLPAGISFFTFQALSYTIDVYRKEFKPLESFIDFLFCVSFFPHLVAGPIIRASVLIPQMDKEFYINKSEFGQGVYLIMSGLFKKVVIADFLSVNYVDKVFDEPLRYSGIENLFAVYAYAIQIYCDFSGYSDMAIGISQFIGFKLPINFNSPYQATSLTDFWRRWHISLSSWLRDYLYIPLGGNRKGNLRTYFNLLMTMLLGGLWHGASWKFVFWGFIHGLGLAIEKAFNLHNIFNKSSLLKFFGWAITFHIVCLAWIFFRADNFDKAIMMIDKIIFNTDFNMITQFSIAYKPVFLIILLGYAMHFINNELEDFLKISLFETHFVFQMIIVFIILFITLQFKSQDIQPFIYFQF